MFCRIKDYLKIKKIYYKALKTSCNNNESYEKLLTQVATKYQFIKSPQRAFAKKYMNLANLNPDFIKLYFTIKEMP